MEDVNTGLKYVNNDASLSISDRYRTVNERITFW